MNLSTTQSVILDQVNTVTEEDHLSLTLEDGDYSELVEVHLLGGLYQVQFDGVISVMFESDNAEYVSIVIDKFWSFATELNNLSFKPSDK